MRLRLLAAFAALSLAFAAPAYAGGNQDHTCQGGHNCNVGGVTSTINNDLTNQQIQGQSQSLDSTINTTIKPTFNVTGGAGGNATAKATSNAAATSTSSATGGSATATGGTATSNSGGNTFSVVDNQVRQTPSVSANGAALAGLANSDCVLSKTKSLFGTVGVPMLALGAGYADGETNPYYECNERAAIPIVANLKGTIQGVDTRVILENMVAELSGVQKAIDEAKGKTTQTSQLPSAPTSTQVAEVPKKVKSDSCKEPNASAWYKAHCLD